MIALWYPAPVKAHSVTTTPKGQPDLDVYHANRLGLSLEEFRKRRGLLYAATEKFDALKWKNGDKLFPASWTDFEQYGAVEITGVARSLMVYGNVPWDDAFPRIIRVRLLDKPSYLDCCVEWLQLTPPVKPLEIVHD